MTGFAPHKAAVLANGLPPTSAFEPLWVRWGQNLHSKGTGGLTRIKGSSAASVSTLDHRTAKHKTPKQTNRRPQSHQEITKNLHSTKAKGFKTITSEEEAPMPLPHPKFLNLHKHGGCGQMKVFFIRPKAHVCFIPNTWQELGRDLEGFSQGLSNCAEDQNRQLPSPCVQR